MWGNCHIMIIVHFVLVSLRREVIIDTNYSSRLIMMLACHSDRLYVKNACIFVDVRQNISHHCGVDRLRSPEKIDDQSLFK